MPLTDLRDTRTLGTARQPLLPRRDDLRAGLGAGARRSPSPTRSSTHFLRPAAESFIDNRPTVYTKGHSEKIIGDFITSGGQSPRLARARDQVSSAIVPRRSEQRRRQPQEHRRLVRTIAAPAPHPLHIDLYWMHCWDALTPIDETMRALDDLVPSARSATIGFLRYARVESDPGADARRVARLEAASSPCRSNTR